MAIFAPELKKIMQRFKNKFAQIEGAIQSIIPTIPFKRFGEPSGIANAVLFLASQEASYIHGTELTVDAAISIIR